MQNFRELLDRQKTYFDTDVTKSYDWRIDQLVRMERMLKENTEALYEGIQKDFKTAPSEYVFEVQAPLGTIEFTKAQLREWMRPVNATVPRALAASGHTAKAIPAAGDATLRFSTITDVTAMVETMPLERAAEAYARMMAGQARCRMVLTMS